MVNIDKTMEWTTSPSNRNIFGHFIESGFGDQVSGLWAEMIYNRAFREVAPFRQPTWEWIGVDAEHYGPKMPSWHSGYDKQDWQLFGDCTTEYTLGTHTFKGTTSLVINNNGTNRCGIKQDKLYLVAGKKYVFNLFAGVKAFIGDAGLDGFGDQLHSSERKKITVTIGQLSKTFELMTIPEEFNWSFTAIETDFVDLSISFSYEDGLLLAYSSLMPADNVDGWRKDVVECLTEIAPPVIRFPGGCFVSFYDWESSIGPRNEREPQTSYYWGGIEENDVGLDEFLRLGEHIGFEGQICFNMMTATPFKARQLVEYLNASEDIGMGRLRMLNGHPQPYSVRLFEMDNEPGRKWDAQQYAEACVEFAEEMRLADPNIELMLAAYSYSPDLLPHMLDICGKHVNYVIYRNGEPEFVKKTLEMLAEYNKKQRTSLKLVNTEWLASCHSIEPYETVGMADDFQWHAAITNDYQNIFGTYEISWNYALNGAKRLLEYLSYGPDFALANFNNLCNTWGQNVLESAKEGAFLSCMGEIFALFQRHYQPVVSAVIADSSDQVYGLATKDQLDNELLYVINFSSKTEKITTDYQWTILDGLSGKSRAGKQSLDNKNVTRITELNQSVGESYQLAPLSITVLAKKK